jgi:Mg-chelatase subunit ChlD
VTDGPLRRPSGRSPRKATPLRRKPKRLTEAPHELDLSAGGQGLVVPGSRRDERRPVTGPGGTAHGTTDEAGAVVPGTPSAIVDPTVRARARQIAGRLAVARPRHGRTARRGVGELATVRYDGGSTELDLDRTLEALAERAVPEDEDFFVRERLRKRRAVVLVVDISGSMRGERVRTAAAAVGALAGELAREQFALVAFWSDAAVLLRRDQPVRPLVLLDRLLALPAEGLTNVAFGLEVAGRQLPSAASGEARVVLLSDCVHNAGADPRPVAATLPRLDVLVDMSGEHDLELGRDLARSGRGRVFGIRNHHDLAPAVNAIFRR